jgi:hypothetical protein
MLEVPHQNSTSVTSTKHGMSTAPLYTM